MQLLHHFSLLTVSYIMHIMNSIYGSYIYSSMSLSVSAVTLVDGTGLTL